MNLWTKALIGLGIGGSALVGWRYFSNLKSAFEGLDIISKVNLHKIASDGIELRLDLTLKNPSDQSLSMKFPFIKLLYKGNVIGTSQVVNKDVNVPAHGEARVDKIMIKLPYVSLLSLGSGLANSIQTGAPIDLSVSTKTTVDTGFKKIPYETVNAVTLNS